MSTEKQQDKIRTSKRPIATNLMKMDHILSTKNLNDDKVHKNVYQNNFNNNSAYDH